MTPEEAIKTVGGWIAEETRKRKYTALVVRPLSDALIALKRMVEKQTPIKPKEHVGEYDFERWPVCPTCSLELMPNGEKYCSDCGQAIDWEVTT